MPELPEVETVRRLLMQRLTGARILSAEIATSKILQSPSPSEFRDAVSGKVIAGVERRGKYLLLRLDDSSPNATQTGQELIVHLKMRGCLRIEASSDPPGPYLCATLVLDGDRLLRFYDMWRWGAWWLLPSGPVGQQQIAGLREMGPEPFAPEFTAAWLSAAFAKRRSVLKPLLLSQKVVAGLGNIYCDESLHRARLHPERRVDQLTSEEISRLHLAIVALLGEAVAQGVAYADALARQSANVDDFGAVYRPRIYDRPGEPCFVCKNSLCKIQLRGRGTTFCPHCQPDADTDPGQETGNEAPR